MYNKNNKLTVNTKMSVLLQQRESEKAQRKALERESWMVHAMALAEKEFVMELEKIVVIELEWESAKAPEKELGKSPKPVHKKEPGMALQKEHEMVP